MMMMINMFWKFLLKELQLWQPQIRKKDELEEDEKEKRPKQFYAY